MKRSGPITRRSPLRATKGPQRRTRLRKVNVARIRARRAKAFGAQAGLCRRSRCCVPGCESVDIHAHHEPPRSVGGLDSDTVPLCVVHHSERHTLGLRRFEERYGVRLVLEASTMRGLVALGEHS